MKLNDVKHNHSLTDLLKVILFALMMLLPFLDVGTRCAYVIANKNAYQSYSNEIVEQTALLNTSNIDSYYVNNQLITTYYDSTITYNNQSGIFGFSQITLDINELLNTTNVNYIGFRFYTSSTNMMRFYDSNGNEYTLQNANNTIGTFSYVVDMTTYNTKSIYNYRNANVNIYKIDKLDNVFQYSISQLENSQLYNWTTQTAIYSGVSTMTSQLGITGKIIPIILCYWLFITIIYILIDIVIKIFTILTHALGSKTA